MTLENIENMSDADFANASFSSVPSFAPSNDGALPIEEPEKEIPESEPENNPAETQEPEIQPEPELDNQEEKPVIPEEENKPEQENKEETQEENKPEETNEPEIDWSLISKPFKANGHDMQVNTPEEAVRLMQKGANYEHKMQQIKPAQKVFETLKEQGLTDPDVLNLMIECRKGNKEAIAKLISDSGIDPLDLNLDGSSDYKAKDYQVSDKQINLKETLDSVSALPKGLETINMIAKDSEWQDSAGIIAENPAIISDIANMKESGIFDKVMNMVRREKTLGNPSLSNVPMIQAYGMVLSYMQQQNLLGTENSQPVTGQQPIARQPAPSKVEKNQSLNDKRKAAAPTKQAPTVVKDEVALEEVVGMSDEEFLKAAGKFK